VKSTNAAKPDQEVNEETLFYLARKGVLSADILETGLQKIGYFPKRGL